MRSGSMYETYIRHQDYDIPASIIVNEENRDDIPLMPI
jgi:hypothetical protein